MYNFIFQFLKPGIFFSIDLVYLTKKINKNIFIKIEKWEIFFSFYEKRSKSKAMYLCLKF
jgi:hypothetical protein